MKIFIASDICITEYQGQYYAKSQYASILRRYYEAFGQFTLSCRTSKADELTVEHESMAQWMDRLIPVNSPLSTLLSLPIPQMEEAIRGCDLVVARCPGSMAFVAARYARKHNIPYFAEIMGCPWDSLWNHSLKGKLIAPYVFLRMKYAVSKADYALYVTSDFLQNRYPCQKATIGVTDVRIDHTEPEILENRIKRIRSREAGTLTLMTTAAVDVKYKGQEYVIRAIPLLNKAGLRIKYVLIGGGDSTRLKEIARECEVEDQVVFAGRQPLDQVFQLLDQADIYVHPSLQEGLPRSVVEAMSRGCPVIGAKTGGIPELIDPGCVVKRKSAQDIAEKILAILPQDKMEALAEQNFNYAKQCKDENLSVKRNAFYDKVKQDLQA